MMYCDTTGIEPDLALTKAKKLVGGSTMFIVNHTVPRALTRLGYSAKEVDEIIEHFTLLPPEINFLGRNDPHNHLGKALLRKGLADEAILHFQKAIESGSGQPNAERAQAQSNIGNALLQKGLVDEAIVQFQQALQLAPGDRIIHNDFGNALLQKGLMDEAIAQFQAALNSGMEDVNTAHIHYNLGNTLRRKNLVVEAIAHYRAALKIEPRLLAAENQLAWVLATCSDASVRNGFESVELARQANELSGGRNPIFLHTLAAAYSESGNFTDAVETAARALELAATENNHALVEALQNELVLYRAGSPYHER